MKSPTAFLIATSLLLASSNLARADMIARLQLNSQPGDFIGQGKINDNTYTPANSNFFTSSAGSLIGGEPSFVTFTLGTVTGSNATNTFTTIAFSTTQLGTSLKPGTYGLPGNTAQRAAFAAPGHAGLDVTFQNRGSNTLIGNFTITEASFFLDEKGVMQIGEFHVTFEQHSESASAALFGTFDYHATAIPEPTSLAFVGVTMLLPVGAWLRRRKTTISFNHTSV